MVVHPRVRLALLAVTLFAIAAVIGVVLASGSKSHTLRDPTAVRNGFVGFVRPSGIPAGDFTLTDENGKQVRLSAYRGRPVVLTFLYSHCEDTCPQTAMTIRGALDQLGHDVPALAVSVDPGHDTQLSAQRFLAENKVLGRIKFLLGGRSTLAPIWKTYGIRPQTGKLDHSAYVILLDAKGVQRVGFPADQLTPEGVEHDLRALGA